MLIASRRFDEGQPNSCLTKAGPRSVRSAISAKGSGDLMASPNRGVSRGVSPTRFLSESPAAIEAFPLTYKPLDDSIPEIVKINKPTTLVAA